MELMRYQSWQNASCVLIICVTWTYRIRIWCVAHWANLERCNVDDVDFRNEMIAHLDSGPPYQTLVRPATIGVSVYE